MQMKKFLCTILACSAIISCVGTAGAVEVEAVNPAAYSQQETAMPWATNSFNMSVPAKTSLSANTSFPMEVGETIRINASYSPNASMDFGVVDSKGTFYYFNVTGGSINDTITIPKHDYYTFSVRNNSAKAVSVTGFVRY